MKLNYCFENLGSSHKGSVLNRGTGELLSAQSIFITVVHLKQGSLHYVAPYEPSLQLVYYKSFRTKGSAK